MMKFFTIMIICVCVHSCANQGGRDVGSNKLVKSDRTDSELLLIEYRNDEKMVLDSIQKYGLDSLYHEIVELFYVVYGSDSVVDGNTKETYTVGELDVRPIKYLRLDINTAQINIQPFRRDSLPINSSLLTKRSGSMKTRFIINLQKRELVECSSGNGLTMTIGDFLSLKENISKSSQFKSYVNEHRDILNAKFPKLVDLEH